MRLHYSHVYIVTVTFNIVFSRLYSQYNEDNKKKGTPEDFHVRATKSVELMNHCLESRPIRECAYDPCYAVYMFTKYVSSFLTLTARGLTLDVRI